MNKPKIIIFRHGESEANVDDTIYGRKQDHLTELTERGIQQARDMCISIEGHIVQSSSVLLCGSPYMRRRQTSKEVQEYFMREHSFYMDYHEDPCIREQEWGNFFTPDDSERKLAERKRHSYFFYRIDDGESGADVYNRMQVFRNTLNNIIAKKRETTEPYDLVLISAHSISLLIYMMCEMGWSYEEYEYADWFDNCDYVVLEHNEKDNAYHITRDGRSLSCKHKK
jgi:broad specificity phosphatase PhoE